MPWAAAPTLRKSSCGSVVNTRIGAPSALIVWSRRIGPQLRRRTQESGRQHDRALIAAPALALSTEHHWRSISERRSLWHVAGDTLDDILIAAAQLDDIMIRIADEDRDLSTLAKAHRSLCDRDIVGL